MDRLWYLLDLSLALPLLLNGFDAFIAALGVCVFISFSMRGYEGITFSDPDKQKASSLGSVVLSCLFGALLIRLSPWIALPTLALTALRYFFLYRLSHESFNEEKLMLIEREPIETKKTYDRIKRVLDIVLGVTILVLFGPVIGVIALTSVISSGRPVFICQKRIGKDCREFEMYKFRTFETKAGKDRITRLGRFLRPLRLDELPQIINIIKGDMSLVGPRPELPSFHCLGMENIPDYPLRLLVKPGLTGWAQINYKYTTTLEEYKVKTAYDLYYVKNRSLMLDFRCLLKTPFAVFLALLRSDG
ncbi:sugar transferase [Mesotoga sp.]|uniref:sugar transferase n=1 Tax=Mesotoga sp. TaxID=2053577 RepID=UPI00345E8266